MPDKKYKEVPIIEDSEGNPLDPNFDPDQLTDEINGIDYTTRPNTEPDSAAINIRRMLSDDVFERIASEPGNEYLIQLGDPQPNDRNLNPVIDPEFDGDDL